MSDPKPIKSTIENVPATQNNSTHFPKGTVESPRFDQLLVTLLEKNNGVFIGEKHDSPAMRQALEKLMPLLKSNGVRHLFIELPQDMVQDLTHIASQEELKSQKLSDNITMSMWKTIQSAKKAGIMSIGYEYPEFVKKANKVRDIFHDDSLTIYQQMKKSENLDAELNSLGWTQRRDDYAANFIKRESKGKYIILGGLRHSSNYEKGDTPSERLGKFSDQINAVWMPLGVAGYKGLDTKLGIPSIDFEPTDVIEDMGITLRGNDKSANFHVKLPDNILNNPNFPWLPPSVKYKESIVPSTSSNKLTLPKMPATQKEKYLPPR